LEHLIQTPLYKGYNIEIDPIFLNVDNVPENTYELDEIIQHSSNIECLLAQQYMLLWNEDKYLEISPGQNNKPLSITYDEHAVELLFPRIYLGQARTSKTNVKVTPFMMATISCIDMLFGQNVDNFSCMNYVSYFSYHKPVLSTTNHQVPQLTDVTTN
jgi:hypothetical protein